MRVKEGDIYYGDYNNSLLLIKEAVDILGVEVYTFLDGFIDFQVLDKSYSMETSSGIFIGKQTLKELYIKIGRL